MEVKYKIQERVIDLFFFKISVYELVRITFSNADMQHPGTYDYCTTSKVIKTYRNIKLAEKAKYDKERAFI